MKKSLLSEPAVSGPSGVVIGRINSLAPEFDVLGFCDDAEEKQSGAFCDTRCWAFR